MFRIKRSYMSILFVSTCCLFAHVVLPALASDQFPDNIEDKNSADESALTMHKRPSFFVGSRYGRSGASGPLFAASKTRRLNVVPRNDRFFLGSRYGKRASEFMSPYEQEFAEAATAHSSGNNKSAAESSAPYMMSCVYTGLKNFYRCSNIEEINNIINQLTTTHTNDDGEDDK